MLHDQPTISSTPKPNQTREWRKNNADRSKRVEASIPKSAHVEWKAAGLKSGLSTSGLMLAVLDFLKETDGERLLELATRNGRRHGLRVQFLDATTGKPRRVKTGRYNKARPIG